MGLINWFGVTGTALMADFDSNSEISREITELREFEKEEEGKD